MHKIATLFVDRFECGTSLGNQLFLVYAHICMQALSKSKYPSKPYRLRRGVR